MHDVTIFCLAITTQFVIVIIAARAIEAWTTVQFGRLEVKREQMKMDDRWLTLEEKKQSDTSYGDSMN